MGNTTAYEYAHTAAEDILIGGGMFFTCVIIGVAYIPCLMVMHQHEDLWKNSCIKVKFCLQIPPHKLPFSDYVSRWHRRHDQRYRRRHLRSSNDATPATVLFESVKSVLPEFHLHYSSGSIKALADVWPSRGSQLFL